MFSIHLSELSLRRCQHIFIFAVLVLLLPFQVRRDKRLDCFATRDDSVEGACARFTFLQNSGVAEIFSGCLQVSHRVIRPHWTVQTLGIAQCHEVVSWLHREDFFVAEASFWEILFRKINIGKFEPSLLIVLLIFKVLVQRGNCLSLHALHISEQANETFYSLLVGGVLLEQVEQNFLGFHHFALRLVPHRQHSHRLDWLGRVLSDHL